MPFPKIKFKKQQYNVSSKSVFVLTVELLDSSVLECTLSAESTGRDCMDNICTRLGLQQPDLFGLRYVSRRVYPKIRWVDLDRPLKKQLEKYSKEPYLYLGVIFYVTDVSLLEDEVTRYHYFLQLKMDVVEGRLRCNYEQAIVLASYSLQAEFGDHDPEKHTAEYLKDFPLLPKPMISHFEDRLGALTDAVITQHASLKGIAQQLAEIYYIVGAQQLEGYGQECFLAKDDTGNEVLIGASLIGICVRKGNGHSPQFFRWKDITNLVNHKKYFGIECQNFEFSVQFVFNEPEAAKYVWKMCVLQHTFFKMHQSATENCEMNITVEPTHTAPISPLPSSPLPALHLEEYLYNVPPGPAVIKPADIKNFQRQSQNIPLSVEKRAGNSSISGGLDRRVGYAPSRIPSQSFLQAGVQSTNVNCTMSNMAPKVSVRTMANTLGSRLPSKSHRLSNSSLNMNDSNMFSPTYLSGAKSTPDLDRLSHTVPTYRTAPDSEIVPAYRPAPDYHTAVQGQYPAHRRANQPNTNRINQMAQMYSSHPEIRPHVPPSYQPHSELRHQHTDLRPSHPDLRQILPGQNILPRHHSGSEFLFPLTTNHTYSTPELNTTGEEMHPLAVYKPPPPYPGHLLDQGEGGPHLHPLHNFSTSTPDLASQTMAVGLVGGSSPDLVSRRTLGPAAGRHNQAGNPDLHRTYDNLTSVSSSAQDQFCRYPAYSTEELNAVYNLGELDQSQLLQNIIQETYNQPLQHNYIYDQQIDTKRLSLHQQESNLLQDHLDQLDSQQLAAISRQLESQQLDQHQLQAIARQLEGHPLDQQQLQAIAIQLEGQQLDQQQLAAIARQLEGQQLDQQQLAAIARQLEGQQLDQQQLSAIARQLEGQQLDQQQLGLLLRQIEGLQLDQQQINLLSRQLESQQFDVQQLSLIARQQLNRPDLGSEQEPIYQNQGQILAEEGAVQQQQEAEQDSEEGRAEPIYQNLPIHQQVNQNHDEEEEEDDEELFVDDTVDGVTSASAINIDRSPVKDTSPSPARPLTEWGRVSSPPREVTPSRTTISAVSRTTVSAAPKFNIRKALTLSREDLQFQVSTENLHQSSRSSTEQINRINEPRRKLEMRQYLEPAVEKSVETHDKSLINSVNNSVINSVNNSVLNSTYVFSQQDSKSKPKMGLVQSEMALSGTLNKKKSMGSLNIDTSIHSSPLSDSNRPKPRKRWGLTMAGKSGSLKSVKSDGSKSGGEESRNSSGRGMGAMMLANLHGLTRSRPDLLSDTAPSPVFRQPTKIPKESIGHYLETKLLEGEVVREFEQIPKKKMTGCNTLIASLPENLERSRFKDVLPYDENRVKINNDKDNKFGYINASHISATVGTSQRFYIAAQGPLPNTLHNFWSMVHACDVHLIVMLTEVSGSTKGSGCLPYWPQNDGSSIEIGDFTITKSFSSDSGTYTTTTLQLLHNRSRRKRRVWHVQYSDWSEQGLPRDVSSYLHFLEEMSAIRRLSAGEIPAGNNKNPPVLVHCSAGVGRTGVTILSDILLYCLDHNIEIDIPKVLTHLREQRMLMVQTLAQYKFVHRVLIHYLGQSRLI